MRATRPEGPAERGAVLILYAFGLVATISMAALVLDLGQLRTDRKVNKSVADLAVRAGIGALQAGPWSGVCRARDYLRANAPGLSNFDAGSEHWFQPTAPLSSITSSPCINTTAAPFLTLCLPGSLGVPRTDTWGRLTATANGGRYTITIQSGYTMPDPAFPEDITSSADTGDPLKGACDNLVVIIKQRRTGLFDPGDKTTTIRSVGRLSILSDSDYNPALLLLDQHKCSVLTTGGANTRVIAQPFQAHPGVIQIDSADDVGGCTSGQAVLSGASTAGGPSIVACNATTSSPTPGCNLATGNAPSRVGIYALNFPRPSSDYVTSTYPGTYGDTQAVPSAQSGRRPLDSLFRKNVEKLDGQAKTVLTGNGGLPPGCTSVLLNLCTAGTVSTLPDWSGRVWLVLQQSDCNSLGLFFLVAGRNLSQNIWFNCDLSVGSPLFLSGPNSYIVVTGQLHVSSTFVISSPNTVFIGGRSTGNKIGLDIGNGGNFSVGNVAALALPAATCPLPLSVLSYTRLVVGKGMFNMASGGAVHLCQTFVYLASGYDKVPTTDGTVPCSATCSTYTGHISVGSGATVDWVAPNLITGRRPVLADVDLTGASVPLSPYEDLGLWTEAGGNTNSLSGGGSAQMTGIYFLGNADSFNLAGNSGANVFLSAQFISTTMKVTGGAVVNLTLNPYDSIPVVVYQLVLVR